MKTRLERARAKHQELVRQQCRSHDRYNKIMDTAFRERTKILKTERALARSQKRLDILIAAETHTGGPTSSVVTEVLKAAPVAKPDLVLNDDMSWA